MKVLLINGSRREHGCTDCALGIVAKSLEENGIDTEIVFVGDAIYNGAIDETVKLVAEKVKTADGLVVGTPVYYASPSGEIISLLDRLFGVAGAYMTHKPAAAICSARRGGTSASLDVLNKYFMFNQMPVVASMYWNMVHGSNAEDVMKDEEGVQIMRVLGNNMAWLLKCIESGKTAGVKAPTKENKIMTNFIR